MTPSQTAQVRALNDKARTTTEGGSFVTTRGIADKGMKFVVQVTAKVVQFTDFNANNDPHGEHDFGSFDHEGETIFFKVDVYENAECVYGAEEPWNPDNSYRVITVLLASEY